MFAVEERDHVRERLLDLAAADPAVVGAAIIGSHAADDGDQWSDIDMAFGIGGQLGPALERWTRRLYDEFGALHHWDLRSGATIYRVFLLPDWLEVDIAFSPAAEFGPRGPQWRTVFGRAAPLDPPPPQSPDQLVGLAWHHALHARVCIERRRWWQAEYWISAVRDQVITLACLRLGHPTDYAKAAHLLPTQLTAPLEETLVRSVDETELRRALHAAVDALAAELGRTDRTLATRLRPMLSELHPTELDFPTGQSTRQ